MQEKTKALVSGFYTPSIYLGSSLNLGVQGRRVARLKGFFCSYHSRHGDAKGTRRRSFALAVLSGHGRR